MNSKNKGNVGEAKVLADLIDKGYGIAQPFGDNLPFDLLAIDAQLNIHKVQVKYATLTNGCVCLRNQRWSSNTKRNYVNKYAPNEVDVFAVYVPERDCILYIPTAAVGSATVLKVRFEETANKQSKGVNKWTEFKEFPNK